MKDRKGRTKEEVEQEILKAVRPFISWLAGKHTGYGQSFDRIYGTFGDAYLFGRLADKFFRVEHCFLHPDQPGIGDITDDALDDFLGYLLLRKRYRMLR